MLLIGDGRIPADTRLPSERELTEALGVSRTTVTRAYATVRDGGYAEARQGSGTFTRVPGGPARAHDRALLPRPSDGAAIDLNCAAPFAPPEIATAYAEAATRLPAYLGGHGYFPAGLPELQAAIAALYDARGLPTDPAQVMVTPGALARRSRSWPRRWPAAATGCWWTPPATPTPPSGSATPAPGWRRPRWTRTAGTSTPPRPGCARWRRGWPT